MSVEDMSRTSTYVSCDEDFLDLPPMTFKLGSRADDSSDSDTDRNEFDERDGREKPLPAPPTSSTLSPPKPSALSSPSPISHISNFSTSTVSTSSSISSLPVTPVTPNTPITPFLSTSPSSTSLLGAPLFTRAVSSTGVRSRQPSVVSLAGGYHLPTMVAGKSSPIISHKTGLPVLNVIDLEEVDADVDGDHLRYLGEETITSRRSVRLNRNPSLGSAHTRTSSPLATDPVYTGVVRRYASAGNLLSGPSSRASSPGGHQYSHSHPLPFSTASPSPLSSFPTHYTGSSSVNTPTASVSDVAVNESRTRSRSNSTGLRNAVYIQDLDSKEVARRLLDLSSVCGEMDDLSDLSASEAELDDGLEQSKWSPASSVVDLRSSASKTSSDLAWGFPKPPKVHAPPPTPSTPRHTFPVPGPSNVPGDTSAPKSPRLEERSRRRSFISVGKRKSLLPISKSSGELLPPVPASPPANGDSQSPLLSTPGKRQRLASFIAKMARNSSSQASPPVPSSPTSPSSSSSVPPLAVRTRASPHRPAPLDLSSKTKEPLSSPILATESETAKGPSEPSTPAYSSSVSSWDNEPWLESDTEDEMEGMDGDLLAVAAGFDLPSVPASPSTPRRSPPDSPIRPISYERQTDFPSTPTGIESEDLHMGRGSYAQMYGFRSPQKLYAGLYQPAANSFSHLPYLHPQDEAGISRGATPLSAAQSMISPGDLPPSGGSLKVPRERKISVINLNTPSSPPTSPPRNSWAKSPASPVSPKNKGRRMAGLISRFSFGSSTSLAFGPVSSDSIPPVPPLKVDELGQLVSDPFAKDDTTVTVIGRNSEESFMSPGVLSPEISDPPTFNTRQRSGTTSTINSVFSTSTFDSSFSSERISPPAKQKRRSLGFSLGTSASTLPSTAGRGKKRKLVISGVAPEDTAAFQAVKRWCEAFGEVRKFEWQQNGNLVVDWRSKSVADMVCRVQANVHIRGAGSVALSWYQS